MRAATARQILRFGIVGVISNLLLYLGYLLLTAGGVGSKLAMTLLYVVGVAQTFAANRRWTFDGRGGPSAFARYFATYALGYAVNWLALAWFVDRLGWPHQAVQGGMILTVAAMVFVLQKYWVFDHPRA